MTRGLTPAELQSLPAVVDLVTAGRAFGIGRTKAYQLAQTGPVSLPGAAGGPQLPGAHC
jgi:hypothetical protein